MHSYAPWAGLVPFVLWLVVILAIGPALDGAMGVYRWLKHHRAVRREMRRD